MNYEFHVDDYVETKTNSIGYISHIDDDDIRWFCVYDADDFRTGSECSVVGLENNELAQHYNHIDKYDFTKPEQPKEIKQMDNVNWNSTIAKINGLVDAVNELRKERI